MSTNPRVTSARAPISYYPFDRAIAGSDFTDLGSSIGVTEMVNILKNNAYISYEFTGQEFAGDSVGSESWNAGYRAATWISAPSRAETEAFRWLNFITGKIGGMTAGAPDWIIAGGDTTFQSCSIRHWYQWGARKFWFHGPFGRVSKGRTNQEAMLYQPDGYYAAQRGCTCPFEGKLGNTPMPWLTNDVVDGITQGFVPLFRALISGSSAGLSEDTWLRLVGTGANRWYDPNDPIEVVSYTGTINQETFRKFRRWFGTDKPIANSAFFGATGETEGMAGISYARYVLERSVEPYKRAGMRIGLDALVRAPGPVVHINEQATVADIDAFQRFEGGPMNPTGQTYGAADAGWWSFFSGYILNNWDKKDIFMEANPTSFPVYSGGWTGTITGFTMNPYCLLGINSCGSDEYIRQGFGGDPTSPPFAPTNERMQYLGEYPSGIEYVRSIPWSSLPHVGRFVGGNTFYDGRHWYLRGLEEHSQDQGSLPPLNFAAGDRYLRATESFPRFVYPGTAVWGGALWADHTIRYQEQLRDQTSVYQDKTVPKILLSAQTLRLFDTDRRNILRNTWGITLEFNQAYPTINDFAKYVANVYNGRSTLEIRGSTSGGFPNYSANADSIIDTTGTEATTAKRISGISPVMLLDPYEWDTFAGTGLRGISAGFYIPTTAVDLPDSKLYTWLDTKLKSWFNTFGEYPTYIAWKMTKDQGGPNSQLGQFQMERFLYQTESIPSTTAETSAAYNTREEYFSFPPVWNSSPGIGIQNIGYASPTISNPNGNSLWNAARAIVISMITKTKEWRDARKLSGIKIGLDNFPYLPETAYSVYEWTGGSSETSVRVSASANWNDSVFPKPNPRPTNGQAYQGGLAGWYTEAETADIKKKISIEYRKRLEPISEFCDFVLPEIMCKTPSDIPSDSGFPGRQQYHRELVNLCYDMKSKRQWYPNIVGVFSQNPTLEGDMIFPITSVSYEGATFNDFGFPINPGDPLTKNLGSLFDRDKFNYAVIDFLRDEFFRPIRGIPRKIDGLFFKSDRDDRAFRAMNTTVYNGREADREWVYKWLVADSGVGATIDWNNSTDVTNKVRQFFGVKNNLTAYYKNRFDRGQPRIDRVSDPYRQRTFAITWHPGYPNGLHPSVLDGVTISDVVPSIFAGYTFAGSDLLRLGGQTGNIQTDYFNDIVGRIRNVPEGRRVLVPYYWHEDPIADQSQQIDYYKATSDGATYTGTVPYRTHETPGQLKFTTPWAYKQTADAALSIGAFFRELAATGAYIDYVACDAEAWGQQDLQSVVNAFGGPWGPTGMPAEWTVPGQLSPVLPLESWKQVPDPRQTPTVFSDVRFGTLVNPFNGKTMGQSILDNYKTIFSNRINAFTPTRGSYSDPNTDTGITAAQLMHYYVHEGATGISGSTGFGFISAYGQVPSSGDYLIGYTNKPWREPWFPSYPIIAFGGRTINKYLTWPAYDKALSDIVMGDLIKKCWFDVIAGSTNERTRRVSYSHYDVMPTGITEGIFATDSNGHPARLHSLFPHIEPCSESYGETNPDLRRARYYISPQTDFERHQFAYHSPLRGTDGVDYVKFHSNTVPARSYIGFLKEMAAIRAMLRNRPDSWKRFNPWVTSRYEKSFNHGWREDQQNAADIEDRTTPAYGDELVYHFLASGAKHINYFFGGGRASGRLIGPGYTAGIIEMQSILNSWNTQTEGYRIQPVSTVDGSTDTLQERIKMSDVGGNHEGATGVFMSGCKLLKYENGRTGSNGNTVEKYLWRITPAPQATKLIKVGTPSVYADNSAYQYEYGYQDFSASGYNIDLPQEIDLQTGEIVYYKARTDGIDRGDFSETWSNWQGGSALPPGLPGGKIIYSLVPSTPAVLTTDALLSGGTIRTNARAEIRLASNRNAQGDGSQHPLGNLFWTPENILPDDQPGSFLVKNRPISIKSRVKILNQPSPTAGYPTSGGKATLAIFGFWRLHFVSGTFPTQPGDRYGLESAVAFYSDGSTGTWKIIVHRSKSGSNEVTTHEFDTGISTTVERDLYIWVSEKRDQAKFYVDGNLVYTANGGLPVGEWQVSPAHAGCAVRDVSIVAVNQPGHTVLSLGLYNMEFKVLSGSNDKIYINTADKGLWIKREGIRVPPRYAMFGQPADYTLKTIYSDGAGVLGWNNIIIPLMSSGNASAGFGENANSIRGVNRTTTLSFELQRGATYPSVGFFQVIKNGTPIPGTSRQLGQGATDSPIPFTVNDGDIIQFRVTGVVIDDPINFTVTVRNINDGDNTVGTFTVSR